MTSNNPVYLHMLLTRFETEFVFTMNEDQYNEKLDYLQMTLLLRLRIIKGAIDEKELKRAIELMLKVQLDKKLKEIEIQTLNSILSQQQK